VKLFISRALNHQGFRRYFANTSWMFAEQILRLAAGLLVGVWVARYLGPEQFGIFSYAVAFAAIFGSIAKLGLDGFVVIGLVREPHRQDSYLGTAFWLKLAGATLSIIATGIALLFLSAEKIINFYVLIIASGTIFQSFEVVDFYFQAKVLSKYISYCKLVQLLISSGLKIYLVIAEADLIDFVLVSLVDQATLALTFLVAYRRQIAGGFFRCFDWALAKTLLKSSWPVILSGFALMVQARIDQVMLKQFAGNAEVGYYTSALRLIEVFGFLPVLLTNSLFPAIVNAKARSLELFRSRLFNLYRLMAILFLLVFIPVTFFGNQIILLLYKEAYAPAGQLIALMAVRLFFTNYGVVRGAYLMNENLMSFSLVTMVIGMLINVGLNFLWIPAYQSMGAIASTIVSFFITTFLLDALYPRTRGNCLSMLRSMLLLRNRS
jgi:O-antigen/teichoic acid export membrane protein